MALDGPWNIPRWQQIPGLDWMVAPMPKGPVKQSTIVGGEYLAIFKQSQNPDSAWAFVKWMVRPDVQALWSMKSGYLPIRHAVRNVKEYNDFLDAHPPLKTYVQQMDFAQAASPIDYDPLKISRHLAYLRRAGIVGARREGQWMHYRIVQPADADAARLLKETMAWLANDPEMQRDRQRMVKLCCAPQLPVSIQGAPRPVRVTA
jgi:DNA-binding transcriptional ArsR family regulator